MKIAMVMSTNFPPEEGIGFHVYNLSKKLIEMNHEVTVITRGSLKIEEDFFDQIKILRVPFIPCYPLHVYFHGFFVKKLIKRFDFDLIHFHNPLVPVIKTEIPTITTMHGSMIENAKAMELIDLKSFFSKILGRTISYNISKNLMKSSDVIITISDSVAQQIEKYYKFDRLNIIPNGVDVDKFYPVSTRDDYIFYAGRLGHGKGIFDLLEAAKQLGDVSDIKIMIAGKGELEEKIRNKIKNECLSNVILLGHANQKEIVSLFQNAKLFVFPSLYEGLPTVILEAMASGIPIVTTSVSGCKDLIKDGYNGLIVPPGSPDKLYKAMKILLENPNLEEYFGKNARSSAENEYSWDTISKKIEILYKSII